MARIFLDTAKVSLLANIRDIGKTLVYKAAALKVDRDYFEIEFLKSFFSLRLLRSAKDYV